MDVVFRMASGAAARSSVIVSMTKHAAPVRSEDMTMSFVSWPKHSLLNLVTNAALAVLMLCLLLTAYQSGKRRTCA